VAALHTKLAFRFDASLLATAEAVPAGRQGPAHRFRLRIVPAWCSPFPGASETRRGCVSSDGKRPPPPESHLAAPSSALPAPSATPPPAPRGPQRTSVC